MPGKITLILLLVIGWGCSQPNRPVPTAHTDTFILYPASSGTPKTDTTPLTDTLGTDTFSTDSTGSSAGQ